MLGYFGHGRHVIHDQPGGAVFDEEILDGSMPPASYTRFGLHGDAKLSESEQGELVAGLRATAGFAED